MVKKRGTGFFTDYEIEKEGADNVLRINYESVPRVPSIEEDPLCMAKTAEILISTPNITKIIFNQKHDYEYDYDQVRLLLDIAKLYKKLVKQKELFSFQAMNNLVSEQNKYSLSSRYSEVHELIFNYLLKDPVGCYVELKRILRREKIEIEKEFEPGFLQARANYIKLIEYIIGSLEATNLIQTH